MLHGNDLHNISTAKRVISPVAIGANATKTGAIIDRLGYGGVEFIASYGAVTTTGSVVTLVAFEGDVTHVEPVAALLLLGTVTGEAAVGKQRPYIAIELD